jgi:hypothetical protein
LNLGTGTLEFGRNSLGMTQVDVGHQNPHTLGSKSPRHCSAQARSTPGNDRYPSLQLQHFAFPSSLRADRGEVA